MIKARIILLATLASLVLGVVGCSGRRAAAGAGTPPADTAATLVTVMRSYNTAASARLNGLEANFNKNLPSGVSPIVYVDYDKVASWYGMPEGPATVDRAIGDYLTAKTGRSYNAPTLALLAKAMNSLDAEGIVSAKDGTGSCLVVPEYPGTSFDSFYAASFRAGETAHKTVGINMSTGEFADFVNAHEVWHCLDIRYIRDFGDGLEGAVKQNRTEMFADIGGVMEGIRSGADLTLAEKAAAVRATWSFLTGPSHAKTPPESDQRFQSIVYATEEGLDALKARIKTMGVENFRQLDREQLRALDYEITDAHCLPYGQAQALQTYYTTGRAPAAAVPLVARLKAIAAASVRDASPAELAAREKSARDAANDGGLTEQTLLEKLRARAGELGSPSSFVNQLQARQEMTDRLRQKLLVDPSSERVTEAQLKLLLYTNPHLVPRKDGLPR
ncbi:MAG: hypothetical protein ACLQVG_14465 [Terriglobia bacterium]